jgi:hypothetical protein
VGVDGDGDETQPCHCLWGLRGVRGMLIRRAVDLVAVAVAVS